jgi:UDPglucose 6-dehydrogenase
VVKSTVPPGTCEAWNKRYVNTTLRVVFNPEFLTEANALRDFEQQDRIIVGGPHPCTTIVKRVYEAAFAGVPVIKTSSTIAETVKYMTNAFLSVKVAFANEMKQVCDAAGADYDKVVEYAKHDRRLGASHWNVPGPDGNAGYGGHCLPKDLNALMYMAKQLGVCTPVMAGAWEKNLEVRPPEVRDWEHMKGRAVTDDFKHSQ